MKLIPKGSSGIIPVGHNVLLRSITQLSSFELRADKPKGSIWTFILDTVGNDVPDELKEAIKSDKMYEVILEQKDFTRVVKSNKNVLDYNAQKELLDLQKIPSDGKKLDIVAYLLTPLHNILGIKEIEEPVLYTAYDISRILS